ncbi:hypothetical protein PV04_10965 [Phialophora macrospora]|uniref:SMODS and SLOG-associating 2TM effector domain-containing protein n=1 Tax=Phialophora macrospora TaxID=1851006 RepID=A0A0D2F7A7_9EURO|nr:hypothetical protein PV04_10965 [Phialophora macrospora]
MSTNGERLPLDPTKSTATATHTQIDGSRPSDASGVSGVSTPSRNMSSSSNSHAIDKRKAFRERVGLPEDATIPEHTLSAHLEKAYRAQTRYYYLVASASHGMLWLQIGIGATVTAIGTTNSNAARIAITVLGAINTVVAGMLTFLKSRNQPNRALQFRNSLRDVYEDLWQVDAETGRDDFDLDKKVDRLWAKYKEAIADSEANYPDLWVSLSNSGKPQAQTQNGSKKGSGITTDATPPKGGSDPSPEMREPLLSRTGS